MHRFIQAATSASTAPAWPTMATTDNRKRRLKVSRKFCNDFDRAAVVAQAKSMDQ
jgi:hypothetical protein